MKAKMGLKILAMGFFIFILFVIFSADMGWKLSIFRWVDYLPFRDKMGHFLLIGVLAFFANVFFEVKKIPIRGVEFLLGSFLVFVFITVEEFSQLFLDNRNFDLLDLAANYLGIFIFGKIAVFIFQKIKNRN